MYGVVAGGVSGGEEMEFCLGVDGLAEGEEVVMV